jgi:hypothetical protein
MRRDRAYFAAVASISIMSPGNATEAAGCI